MDSTADSRQVTGALRFLAELRAFAVECAATGVWDDELTALRRRRESARAKAEQRQASRQVEAL